MGYLSPQKIITRSIQKGIANASILAEVFPNILKESVIVFIYKNGEKSIYYIQLLIDLGICLFNRPLLTISDIFILILHIFCCTSESCGFLYYSNYPSTRVPCFHRCEKKICWGCIFLSLSGQWCSISMFLVITMNRKRTLVVVQSAQNTVYTFVLIV